jgi:hypothetical protein
MEYSISTYRNEHGYWVAAVDQGEFRSTRAWARTKKKAKKHLREALANLKEPTK